MGEGGREKRMRVVGGNYYCVGRPADLWVQAKRGFSELLSTKKGFGREG